MSFLSINKIKESRFTGIVIGLLLILGIIIWASLDKKKLLENHKISIAQITESSYGGRGHGGTITILFKFNLMGKEVDGSSAFSLSEINVDDVNTYFMGKTFPVIYNPENPDNNFLLIRERDFKQFNIPFPDSLKWVLQYVHEK